MSIENTRFQNGIEKMNETLKQNTCKFPLKYDSKYTKNEIFLGFMIGWISVIIIYFNIDCSNI